MTWRERRPHITTGASGSSFLPPPRLGKCAASSRDTASMPLIAPRGEIRPPETRSPSPCRFLPSRRRRLARRCRGRRRSRRRGRPAADRSARRCCAAVSQIRSCENTSSARSRAGWSRNSGAPSSAPSTTKRTWPEWVASPALIARSITAITSGGKMRRTRQRCSTRCLPMRLMPMLPSSSPTRRRRQNCRRRR